MFGSFFLRFFGDLHFFSLVSFSQLTVRGIRKLGGLPIFATGTIILTLFGVYPLLFRRNSYFVTPQRLRCFYVNKNFEISQYVDDYFVNRLARAVDEQTCCCVLREIVYSPWSPLSNGSM